MKPVTVEDCAPLTRMNTEAIKARDPEASSAGSFDRLHLTTQLIRNKLDALQDKAGPAKVGSRNSRK